MKELSQEELNRWKETFAKDGIIYKTDDEYREAMHNFTGFIDTLIKIDKSQKATNEKSTGEPYLIDRGGNKIIL